MSTLSGASASREPLHPKRWLPAPTVRTPWLRPRTIWFAALVSALCFEGLGRKFIPQVPAWVFYFLKDAVLLVGVVRLGPFAAVANSGRYLYRGFGIFLAAAFSWTLIETVNPAHVSGALAVVGLRSYWLWWIAPFVVASALRGKQDREYAVFVLVGATVIVALYAALQFAMPSSAQTYALYEGEEVVPIAMVATTGRVRVSSTFGYISGFTDFVVLVPALLLSLGLSASERRVRIAALIGVATSIVVMPMTGSRSPVILASATMVLVILGARLRSRVVRRTVVAGAVAVSMAFLLAGEAIEGVRDRFQGQDTRERIEEALELLPPFAIMRNEYPLLGIGTGMQQNARVALRILTDWATEGEPGRYLIELGLPGYLFVWLARLGLCVGLLRAAFILRRAGRGAVAGAAYAYAFFAMQGNLTFDHIFQALFFLGSGMILAEVVETQGESGRAKRQRSTAPDEMPPGEQLPWARS